MSLLVSVLAAACARQRDGLDSTAKQRQEPFLAVETNK